MQALTGTRTPTSICDAGEVPHQLSYQAKGEHVATYVDYEPVDVEVDGDNTGIFHVLFEMLIGMNEFDHRMENSRIIIISLHIYGFKMDPHNNLLPVGLIAQLLEHCTGIAKVR